MFDLYGLPADFPGNPAATQIPNPFARVKELETALKDNIADWRFIPYIQLYEFEALLLSEPQQLQYQFPDSENAIHHLTAMVSQFPSPEHIDDGVNTAPSKRIIEKIPEYEGRKASAGPIVAGYIGLSTLRLKCAHFAEWLDKLERLAENPNPLEDA